MHIKENTTFFFLVALKQYVNFLKTEKGVWSHIKPLATFSPGM